MAFLKDWILTQIEASNVTFLLFFTSETFFSTLTLTSMNNSPLHIFWLQLEKFTSSSASTLLKKWFVIFSAKTFVLYFFRTSDTCFQTRRTFMCACFGSNQKKKNLPSTAQASIFLTSFSFFHLYRNFKRFFFIFFRTSMTFF